MKLNHNFVLMKIFLLSAYSLLNFVATPLYILVLPINKLLQKNTNKTDFVNYFSTLLDDVWFTLYFCVVADFTVLYNNARSIYTMALHVQIYLPFYCLLRYPHSGK